jgi:hypothetical protein
MRVWRRAGWLDAAPLSQEACPVLVGQALTRRRLARGFAFDLARSPDRRRIAFTSNDQIYVMNADGSNKQPADPRPQRHLELPNLVTQWPNHRLPERPWRQHRDLYVMAADGTHQKRITT